MKFFLNLLDKLQTLISKIQYKLGKKNPSISADIELKKKIIRDELSFPLLKDISEYLIKNEINIEKTFKDLDKKSMETVKRVLKAINYMYTHNILDVKYLFSLKDLIKKREIDIYIQNIKKKLVLSIDLYEASIFFYKCGLKFVPLEMISKLRDKDFIDGGAYIGDSALIFEKYYHPKRIYAFEPELINFNLLLKTIKINNLRKVMPINQGLGEKKESLKFKSHGILSQISEEGEQSISVIGIDNFVFEKNLKIGLIKLDIEGFELNVIKGARKTIKKFKPILLIAIYHNGKQFFETIKHIQEIDANYHFIIRKLDPSMPFVETQLIAWPI
ncbi:MAG: FkbM family methyltransferase [Promethearchaeota archaeon]